MTFSHSSSPSDQVSQLSCFDNL